MDHYVERFPNIRALVHIWHSCSLEAVGSFPTTNATRTDGAAVVLTDTACCFGVARASSNSRRLRNCRRSCRMFSLEVGDDEWRVDCACDVMHHVPDAAMSLMVEEAGLCDWVLHVESLNLAVERRNR